MSQLHPAVKQAMDRVMEAHARTAAIIGDLADARRQLQRVRDDPGHSAETVMKAASLMRERESQLKSFIEDEVKAHIELAEEAERWGEPVHAKASEQPSQH